MKKLILYSSLALYGALSVGCSKDLNEGGISTTNDLVSISSVSLAGTENVTSDGAQIEVVNTVNSATNTYSFIDASWVGSNPAFGWTDPATILKAFLVKDGMTVDEVTFPLTGGVVDQSSDASLCDYMYYESGASDYLYSDIVDADQNRQAAISFTRMGAKVVYLVTSEQFPEGAGTLQTAVVKSAPGLAYSGGDENGIGGAWSAQTGEVSVKSYITTSKNSATAIIAPAAKYTPYAEFTINGSTYTTDTAQDNIEVAPLSAGKIYTFEVTISKNYGLIAISLASITPWDDKYTVLGDAYEDTEDGRTEPWNGEEYGSFNSGSGTEEDPYIINIPGQLAQLVTESNSAATADTYYKISDNSVFDMNGKAWTPIGSSSTPFKGNLDGNGVVIKNLSISGTDVTHLGLFGYLSDATISGITIDGATVTNAVSDNVATYIAALAGYSAGTTGVKTKISNCVVTNSTVDIVYAGTTTKTNRAGGILGSGDYTFIENCHVSGSTIQVTGSDSGSSAAGIASYLGQYENNLFASSVQSTTCSAYSAGGIICAFGFNSSAFNFGQNSIAGCYVASDVTLVGGYGNTFAAGIVGATYGYMYGCYTLTSSVSGAGWADNNNAAVVGKFTEFTDATDPYLSGPDFWQESYTTVSSLASLDSWSGYVNGSWASPTYDIPSVNPVSGNSIVVGSIGATEVAAMNTAIQVAADSISLGYTYEYELATDGGVFPYVIKKVESLSEPVDPADE